MDRGAWRTTVHRVIKSWTRLSNFHYYYHKKSGDAIYCQHGSTLHYLLKKLVFFKRNIYFHMCACAQSCPTPCNPMDYSLPASSVHGIPQVRILEWVAISSSTGSSWPRDWTHVPRIGRRVLYHSHLESWFPHTSTKKTTEIETTKTHTPLPTVDRTWQGKAIFCIHFRKSQPNQGK